MATNRATVLTARTGRWLALLAACLLTAGVLRAQNPADEVAIRHVMQKSADDWNRGDLDAFATSYKNSPDTLFIGSTVSRGYDGMLATYKRIYNTPEKRGTLTFSNLEVHMLDARYAALIGNCHLARTQAGGGDFDCIYSLLFEKTPAGWKIILDHSSPVAVKKP
jgi:uncharacterized protein (TIGR02246 family)